MLVYVLYRMYIRIPFLVAFDDTADDARRTKLKAEGLVCAGCTMGNELTEQHTFEVKFQTDPRTYKYVLCASAPRIRK